MPSISSLVRACFILLSASAPALGPTVRAIAADPPPPLAFTGFTALPEPGDEVVRGRVTQFARQDATNNVSNGASEVWKLMLAPVDADETGVPYPLNERTIVVTRDGQWRGFGSIRVGQTVEILRPKGSDGAARAVVLPDDSPDVPDANAFASAPETPALWQEQQGALSLRVIQAGWFPRPQIAGEEATNKAPIFGVWWEFSGPPPRRAATYGLRSSLAELNARAQVLDRDIAQFYVTGDNHLMRATSENVSPDWEKMTIAVDALDPLAPEGADGTVRSVLQWKDIAFDEKGQILPVGQTLKTQLGTRITLDSLQVEGELTRCKFRVQPAADSTRDKFELLPRQIEDETGHVSFLRAGGANNDGAPTMTIEQTNSGRPPAGAKRIALTFVCVERAPDLADPKWMHHFRFTLSPRQLYERAFGKGDLTRLSWSGSPVDFGGAIVASARGASVAAQIETTFSEWSGQQEWRFWMAPLDEARERVWKLRELKVSDGAKALPVRLDYWPDEPHYLKANGDVADRGERSDRAEVRLPEPPPSSVQVEATVEELRRVEHRWNGELALPKLGDKGELQGETGALGQRDFFQIVRLMRFTDAAELSGAPASWREAVPGPGLAMVVRFAPILNAAPDGTPGATTGEFRATAADNSGAILSIEPPHDERWIAGDATQNTNGAPGFITFLFNAPTENAKQLEVWLSAAETRPTGRVETLKFAPITRVAQEK